MFYDWDKVNRSGISFRLLSIILEDLPQLVIQSVAAAYSNDTISPVAITSIALTAMYVTRINAYFGRCHSCAHLNQLFCTGYCCGNHEKNR
jgi:hypothetical protein